MQNSTLVVCPDCQCLFPEGPGRCPSCGELPPPGGFKDTVACVNPDCRLTLTAGESLCGCGARQPDLMVLEPGQALDPPGPQEGC